MPFLQQKVRVGQSRYGFGEGTWASKGLGARREEAVETSAKMALSSGNVETKQLVSISTLCRRNKYIHPMKS